MLGRAPAAGSAAQSTTAELTDATAVTARPRRKETNEKIILSSLLANFSPPRLESEPERSALWIRLRPLADQPSWTRTGSSLSDQVINEARDPGLLWQPES